MKATKRQRAPSRRAGDSVDDGTFALTSDSVHDLTSPVNQINSMLELLLKKQQAVDPESKVLFGFLETAAKRLQNLIAGLTTYAQMANTPAAYRRCGGEEMLDAALAMVRPAIAGSAAIVTRGSLPELYCDPGQVSYVFASLIDNAIKFRGESSPEIHIGAIPQKKDWILSVRDNGIGIDPRFHERIFGAFKRIHHDTYPGAGVGLAIAKHLIKRHRGRIWVESEPGKGATFFFALPKIDERAHALAS